MGDVVVGIILQENGLVPPFKPSPAPVLVTVFDESLWVQSLQLASELRAAGRPARVIPEVDGIVARLAETCRAGDLVLIMSNGGFGGIQEKLAAALSGSGGHA